MSSDADYIIKPEAKGPAVDYSQFPLLLKVRFVNFCSLILPSLIATVFFIPEFPTLELR